MEWRVFFASAAGRNHLADGLACQDCGDHELVDGVFIGALCDGAGSASEGRLGAELFAGNVTELLAYAVRAGHVPAGDDAAKWREFLIDRVGEARARVAEIAYAHHLDPGEFACTLVACIASGSGGCFFHVGDGYGILQRPDGASLVSRPENGEFADETYFVTDGNWQEHLRVMPFAGATPGCLIGLMSDGAAPFVVNRAKTGFYPPFIDPVVGYLAKAGEEDGNRALESILADKKTLAITADDKALLLALAG